MSTYSFMDVVASITGAGGSFPLASDAGVADEGITFSLNEAKNQMSVGADGKAMHTLVAGNGGKVSVTLQKTSPVNAKLTTMFNLQKTIGSLAWGKNTITMNNRASSDNGTALQCAFTKMPDFRNAKVAGTVVWEFDAGEIDINLGTYAETYNG